VIDRAFAERFAAEWIAAWNAHDLPRVLALYAEDFAMASPRIVTVAGEPSGRLTGKAAIAGYWTKALAARPDLRFEPLEVLVGADGVALRYRNHHGQSAVEVFEFGADRTVTRAAAHYSS
jgi:ketosteroid isomerase-like protein